MDPNGEEGHEEDRGVADGVVQRPSLSPAAFGLCREITSLASIRHTHSYFLLTFITAVCTALRLSGISPEKGKSK